MSELRQRPTATTSPSNRSSQSPARTQPSRNTPNNDHGISVLDIVRVLATLVLVSCGLSYYITNYDSLLWGYRPWFTRWPVMKSYLVLSLRTSSLPVPALTHSARSSHPHPGPIIPLQRHRRLPPDLPRRQRLRLRRLGQPGHLRPGRQLQFLRGPRCDARVRHGLFPGGSYGGSGRRRGYVFTGRGCAGGVEFRAGEGAQGAGGPGGARTDSEDGCEVGGVLPES